MWHKKVTICIVLTHTPVCNPSYTYARTENHISELWKVCHSGAISRSLVHCCCYKSSLKHFIFFARRMSLQLAVTTTQKEAGARVAMWKNRLLWRSSDNSTLWRFGVYVSSYRWPRACVLAGGRLRQCRTTDKHRLSFVSCCPPILPCTYGRAVNILAINTLSKKWF